MKLFLAGDVMTGRGIDQILEHPGDPTLHERWARSAQEYVRLAEQRSGPIPQPVAPSYIWGEALDILDGADVDARVINLETAVTDNEAPWPGKGIHYRMHPENIDCITAAEIDCCVLANNHILDWSHAGLEDTLTTCSRAGLSTVGAGLDEDAASAPAVVETGSERRVLVFALGAPSSGVPRTWRAGTGRPGVAMASSVSRDTVEQIAKRIEAAARDADTVVFSIHWGPNWGYEIPAGRRRFAHDLIDQAGVDVVHGHSSHHPLAMEVYRDRPIFYGCGDLINDYEGIGGHEEYHPDLRVLYLVSFDSAGDLESVELVPMVTERFSLRSASLEEREWLRDTLTIEGEALGTSVDETGQGLLALRW